MLSFIILVICMLAACLAFLVWSFWPVLHGKDFTRFERQSEEQERREFLEAVRRHQPTAQDNRDYLAGLSQVRRSGSY